MPFLLVRPSYNNYIYLYFSRSDSSNSDIRYDDAIQSPLPEGVASGSRGQLPLPLHGDQQEAAVPRIEESNRYMEKHLQ